MSARGDDGLLLRGTGVARKRREATPGDKVRFCIKAEARAAALALRRYTR